jgi:hypothetical protein
MAFKHIIDQILLWGWFKLGLYPIEETIGEFLGIALDSYVCWLTAIILISKTEFKRIVGLSLCQFHKSKHFLELVEQVIIDHLVFILDNFLIFCVDGFQNIIPKLRYHKELLHHANHVADGSQIS